MRKYVIFRIWEESTNRRADGRTCVIVCRASQSQQGGAGLHSADWTHPPPTHLCTGLPAGLLRVSKLNFYSCNSGMCVPKKLRVA